jgi:hypothetical protein
VEVHIATNGDPEQVGAEESSRGLAMCRASVNFPAEGYRAAFGWVQLVKSTDNHTGGAEFEMDPLEILGPVPHPFGFYGIQPVLFDAPSRSTRADLAWTCHSFLTAIIVEYPARLVRCLVGFSWGFTITDGHCSVFGPERLSGWDSHLALLAHQHRDWGFEPTFEMP